MRRIALIAARDYVAAVRTKAFVIGLLFLPTVMYGGMIVQWLMMNRGPDRPPIFAVVDRSSGETALAALQAAFSAKPEHKPAARVKRSESGHWYSLVRIEPSSAIANAVQAQRLSLSARVKAGEFTGLLEIGPDVFATKPSEQDDRSSVRYQSNMLNSDGFPRSAVEVVNEAVRKRRAAALQIPWESMMLAVKPVPLKNLGLSQRDATSGQVTESAEESRLVSIMVPISLVLLMFMMVFTGATPLLQSVAEERAHRVAELLLSAVRPFELMAGKLLGNLAVGLTTIVVYLGAAYVAAHRYGYDQFLSPTIMAWFLLFQILGVLIYGSLYIAVGAACNDSKQIQTFLMPITLLAVTPMFALASLIQNPQSPLAAWLSFMPFATPMLMILRIAIPPGVAWWQPALGALIMLVTAALCVFAAGRVFRIGLLMQGKGGDVREMMRWILRG
jgi:ABC-2 type transport system permease protein